MAPDASPLTEIFFDAVLSLGAGPLTSSRAERVTHLDAVLNGPWSNRSCQWDFDPSVWSPSTLLDRLLAAGVPELRNQLPPVQGVLTGGSFGWQDLSASSDAPAFPANLSAILTFFRPVTSVREPDTLPVYTVSEPLVQALLVALDGVKVTAAVSTGLSALPVAYDACPVLVTFSSLTAVAAKPVVVIHACCSD